MDNKYKLKSYILVVRTTEKCKVGCFHCSISATKKGFEQNTKIAKNAINEAIEYGVSRIHLSGGEPLLYYGLPQLVEVASNKNVISGITSSTFTDTLEDTRPILIELKKKGMKYVMLSYDEPHSKRVSISQFCEFTKLAQELDLEVCIFVTEYQGTSITADYIKKECVKIGVDIEKIDWTIADYQYEGRGEKHTEIEKYKDEHQDDYPRCPIVLSAATLNPDGKVFLCNCSRLDAKYFTVGNYPEQSIHEILNHMESSPIYRYLAKYGPQKSLKNLGLLSFDIPSDMCRACDKYLTLMEQENMASHLFELAENDDLDVIETDYEGLLPIYQRHMQGYGEKIESK